MGKYPEKDNHSNSPGPCQYNPSHQCITERTTFNMTFGSKSGNFQNTNMHFPGPGTYTINEKPTKGIKFGNEIRDSDFKKSLVPGPGAYEHMKIIGTHQKGKIGSSQRDDMNKVANVPGPGQYNFREIVGKEGTKLSLSGRPKSAPKFHNPGPGAYEPNKKFFVPSYVIKKGLEKPNKSFLNVPGPGQYTYDFEKTSLVHKAPNCKIGNDLREKQNLNKSVPGPGQYNMHTSIGEGPKINLAMKLPSIQNKLAVPGPGAYCPDKKKVLQASRVAGIGYGQRGEYLRNSPNVPGADAYQYRSFIKEGPKFGYTFN
jgi:Sperm-tail PG-rich repeat